MAAARGAPDIEILVNGADVPPEVYAGLLDVLVQDDTEALSACSIALSAESSTEDEVAWADGDLFAVGGEVEIKLGGGGALGSVFKGEITGVELELSSDSAPRFVARGYDRRHRLMRGSRTRTFTKSTDSDIAARIARENGLSAKVTDTKLEHEYVLQHGTDLEFLRDRAAAIGYEVKVEGKDLFFRPVDGGAAAAVVLRAATDLSELSARLTARQQVGRVEVRGWDPEAKQEIVGKAASGDERSMGEKGGPEVADAAFGEATLTLVDRALAKQEEADKVALAALSTIALGFVSADGACLGRSDLRAGLVVELRGLGKRFSGAYYLTSVTHSFSTKSGYKTSFSGRRNAT